MQLLYSKNFVKSSKNLPKPEKNKLANLLEIFKNNPFHQNLHAKPLTGPLSGFYSFRITRDWRVIFKFIDSEKIFLIEVGHRKNIYN